jgi:hypothetical protein
MANTFLTLKDYAPLARVGAKMVGNDLKIASTFNRDFQNEFGGKRGMTVNVKVPSALIARARNKANARTQIIVDEIAQSTFPVSVDGMAYNAVELDEYEKAYSIEDFSTEVLQPQTEAVADFVENEAIAAMKALPDATGDPDATPGTGDEGLLNGVTYDPATPDKFFVAARKVLVDNGLPASGLWAAVGTQVYADLLDSDVLKDASQSGSTDALREAQTGKVRGFTVVEAPMLDENEIVFYGRHSFTLVVRAPQVPRGAGGGASVSAGGYAATLVYDYDSNIMVDRSVVTSFVSVANLPTWKVERDYVNETADVVEKPSALRIPDVSAI